MEVFRLFGTVSINKAKAIADLNAVNAAGAGVGTKLGNVFKKLGKVAIAAFALIAAAGALIFVKAIKKAAEFELGMAKVKAITGATAEEFAALTVEAERLGLETAQTMTDIAAGMEALGRAGFDAGEIIDAMGGIVALAESQTMELARAAEITANMIRQMGLEASDADRVVNLLAAAASSSNTTVESLGESMKFFGPIAHAMGMSLEEAVAAVAKLGDAGLKGGIATRALSSSLQGLAKPTDEAADMMDELGISMFDANGEFVGLDDAMAQLEVAFADLTQEQQLEAMATIFGTGAVKQFSNLLGIGSEELAAYTEEITGTTVAFDQQAAMLDTLSGQWQILKGSVELLFVTIGTDMMPILKDFLHDRVIPLVNGITNWIKEMGGLKGVIGHMMVAIGKYIQAAANWIQSNEFVRIAVEGVWNVLKELWSFVKNVFKGDWAAAWQDIKDVAVIALTFIKDIVVATWDALPIPDEIKTKIENTLTDIKDFAIDVFVWIKDKAIEAWAGIKASVEENGDGIITAWDELKTSAVNLWNAINGAFTSIMGVFGKTGEDAITFGDVVKGAFDIILITVTTVLGGISDAFDIVAALLRGDWSQAWTNFKDFLRGIWDGIVAILDVFGLVDALEAGWTAAREGVIDFLNDVTEWFSYLGTAAYEWGKDMLFGFRDGILSAYNAVKDAVVGAAEAVVGWFKGVLGIKSPSTVMKGIGEDTGMGFVEGLLAKGAEIEAAGQALIDSALQKPEEEGPARAETAGTETGEAYADGVVGGIEARETDLDYAVASVVEKLADGAATLAEELDELEGTLSDATVGSYAYGEALKDLTSFHENLVSVAEYLEGQNIEVDASLQGLIDSTKKYASAQASATAANKDQVRSLQSLQKEYEELKKARSAAADGSIEEAEAIRGLQSQYDGLMNDVDRLQASNEEVEQGIWDQIAALEAQGITTRQTAKEAAAAGRTMEEVTENYDALTEAREKTIEGSVEEAEVLRGLQSEYNGLMGDVDRLEASNVEVSQSIRDQIVLLEQQGVTTRLTAKEAAALSEEEKRLAEETTKLKEAQEEADEAAQDLADTLAQELKEAAQKAADAVSGLVDAVAEGFGDMIQGAFDYYRDKKQAAEDHAQEMLDIEENYLEDKEDMQENHQDDMADSDLDYKRKREDITLDYTRDIAELEADDFDGRERVETRYRERMEDAATDYARKREDIESDYTEAIQDLSDDVAQAKEDEAQAYEDSKESIWESLWGLLKVTLAAAKEQLYIMAGVEAAKALAYGAAFLLGGLWAGPLAAQHGAAAGTAFVEAGLLDISGFEEGAVFDAPTMLPAHMVAEGGVSEAYLPLSPRIFGNIGQGIVDALSVPTATPALAGAGIGGDTINVDISFDKVYVRDDQDITRLAEETHSLWRSRMRGVGRNV